jgi:hypothetical protein
MPAAASPQKRQANRRNALKSTGPKSLSGKRSSAMNARRHGLASKTENVYADPAVIAISKLFEQDGFKSAQALEVAERIVHFERNQEHQRQLFLQLQHPNRTETTVHEGMRNSFGTELDLMADVLDEQRYLVGRIKKSDLNFVINIQHKMLKLTLRQLKRQDAEHAKQVRSSVRYLRRSSNQLIKSLKGLQPA